MLPTLPTLRGRAPPLERKRCAFYLVRRAPSLLSMPYTRLAFDQQNALLRRILDRARPSGSSAKVVVFDLDGTLLDNRPRTCAILRELSREWASLHPAESALLAKIGPEQLEYLVSDSLTKLEFSPARVTEACAYWKAHFFADDHIRFDQPLPGAVEFTRACYESGAIIAYFTGRDLPQMSVGSWKSLRDLGFPIGVPGAELVLKPAFEMPDADFKREYGPRLARLGEVVAVFDNEPGNCNVILDQFGSAECVFVDTQHFPGAPALDPRVHVVGDFAMGG